MDLDTVTETRHPCARADLPPWRGGDAYLAGGTWLFSEPQPRLTRLIDLGRLGWPPLEPGANGLRIAATCTFARLAATEIPLFVRCSRALVGSFKIWNAATVGGNLCMALPAGPIAALATALDGVCVIWGQDGPDRRVPARDFVLGAQRTVLRGGELLRSIELPAPALRRRAAFRQIALSPLGRSAALLVGTLAQDGAFAVTVTAATPHPVRCDFAAVPTARELREAILARVPDGLWHEDVHGAPDWRRHMALLFAEQIRRELAAGTDA